MNNSDTGVTALGVNDSVATHKNKQNGVYPDFAQKHYTRELEMGK